MNDANQSWPPPPSLPEPVTLVRQETGLGWASLALLALYFGVAFSGLSRYFGNNGARVIAVCFFGIPPASFVLGILSRRTWMGKVGIAVSVLLLIFLFISIVWIIGYIRGGHTKGHPFHF